MNVDSPKLTIQGSKYTPPYIFTVKRLRKYIISVLILDKTQESL